jgi:hypothetical protein
MQNDNEDKIRRIRLISGVGDGEHTACLMSARSLLDGRSFSDAHPSAVLRTFGVWINDASWWDDDAERTRVLLPVALDVRLCASRVDASLGAERLRAFRLADVAVRRWAPIALDVAGMWDEARRLRELEPVVDERTARAASAAAWEARAAANSRAAAAADTSSRAAAAADTSSRAAAAASCAAHAHASASSLYAEDAAISAADAAVAAVAAVAADAMRGEAIALLLEIAELRALG